MKEVKGANEKKGDVKKNLENENTKLNTYTKDLIEKLKDLHVPKSDQEEGLNNVNQKSKDWYETLLTPHFLELTHMDKIFDEEIKTQFKIDGPKSKIEGGRDNTESAYSKANDVTTAQITYYSPKTQYNEKEDKKKGVDSKDNENKFTHTVRISQTTEIRHLHDYMVAYFNAPKDFI